MDAPAVIYALRWLIHDTFRQTLTSWVFWILLGASAMCIVFCLGISVEGGAVREGHELFHPKTNELIGQGREPAGRVSLLFGVFNYTFSRTADEQVHFLFGVLTSWVAGVIGMLMLLIFTAGFLPESLQPSAAAVLLAKPTPRWLFLLGKYLGVVCFVALQITIFFVGTLVALGLRTGVWQLEYLLGIPLMVFHFAIVFSFSVLLAVLFRSTMGCVVGCVLFWIACFAINYGRHFVVVYADLSPNGPVLPSFTVFLSEAGYWIFPKPEDLLILMEKSLNISQFKGTWESELHFVTVERKDLFHPIAAILSSCLFPIFALWGASAQLSKTDY